MPWDYDPKDKWVIAEFGCVLHERVEQAGHALDDNRPQSDETPAPKNRP
jgi:hypothetical protein